MSWGGWVDNPYWQVLTGETYLQTGPPIDPSSLTRWRQRLGEAGVEELLAATIAAGQRSGALRHAVYEAARTRHPRRWSGKTRNWSRIDAVHLNPQNAATKMAAAQSPLKQAA